MSSAETADAHWRGAGAGDARCREALDLFCDFLGTTAGNLALTPRARGGVCIGGGTVPPLAIAVLSGQHC